jgi:hypothetical protein
MALFEDNQQLSKQQRYDNLTQTKMGQGKGMMALLGYNALGEQNGWGKLLAMNPIGAGAGMRHRIATGVADGTSKDILKATQDEASAMGWSKAALAFQVAKATVPGANLLSKGSSAITKLLGGGAEAKSGFNAILGGAEKLTGDLGVDPKTSFISRLLGDEAGLKGELNKLNEKVTGNTGAKDAIGNMMSGNIFGAIGNSIVASDSFLKEDDRELKNLTANNTIAQTDNYL